jgi:N-acetylmuramoyl-L-alanine amidase
MSRRHVVRQGESLASIAYREGLLPQTIWDHPDNAEFCEQRPDPNVLYPGDVIYIPDKETNVVEAATEQTHRFRKKTEWTMVKLRLIEGVGVRHLDSNREDWMDGDDEEGESSTGTDEESATQEETPRDGLAYVLRTDTEVIEGETDEDGLLECRVPADTTRAQLTVEPGTANETTYELMVGHLNPLSTVSGAKQRLTNLGFLPVDDTSEETTAELEAAVRHFQRQRGLPVTGELDEDTRSALQELHQR